MEYCGEMKKEREDGVGVWYVRAVHEPIFVLELLLSDAPLLRRPPKPQ